MRTRFAALCLAVATAFHSVGALAAAPREWGLGLQDPASLVMEETVDFHNIILILITLITLFVLALLIYVMWRYAERKNPTPGRTTHNTLIEVLWTAIPVVILVIIAVPSFRLLYFQERIPEADMTIKATGYQWYWGYEYPDNGGFSFDAILVPESDLQPGQLRLLETDNRVVVPVDTTVRIQACTDDILHSWAVPALGVKKDAVPGRLNEMWFNIEEEGVYYGQCSELCGVNHGYMPITVEAVSRERFDAWVRESQQKFARTDAPAEPQLAAVPASAE